MRRRNKEALIVISVLVTGMLLVGLTIWFYLVYRRYQQEVKK
jgi:hypothetical protein